MTPAIIAARATLRDPAATNADLREACQTLGMSDDTADRTLSCFLWDAMDLGNTSLPENEAQPSPRLTAWALGAAGLGLIGVAAWWLG